MTTDIIDTLSHPQAMRIRKLLDRETRLSTTEILIDDIENIEQALLAGLTLSAVYFSENTELPAEFVNKISVPLYQVATRTTKKLFDHEKISRVFAIADLGKPLSLYEAFHASKRDIVVLDGVRLSGNAGAIMRTATAFGIGGLVVLNAERMDVYDRRTIRASRGTIFHLPVVTASLAELLAFCKSETFLLLAASADAPLLISEAVNCSERLAIVLGAEKTGCSDELTQQADLRAKIPMSGPVESLNVSVAASIALYLREQARA